MCDRLRCPEKPKYQPIIIVGGPRPIILRYTILVCEEHRKINMKDILPTSDRELLGNILEPVYGKVNWEAAVMYMLPLDSGDW